MTKVNAMMRCDGTCADATAVAAANKVFAERFNLTYDLAWSYELLNFFQHGQSPDARGVTTL